MPQSFHAGRCLSARILRVANLAPLGFVLRTDYQVIDPIQEQCPSLQPHPFAEAVRKGIAHQKSF